MELSTNLLSKSQRKQKKQKDRRKTNQAENNVDTPSSTNTLIENTECKPQRANRRQRNEQESKIVAEKTPTTQEQKKNMENFEAVVDHSNLKRETEEIAKLKERFTRREITSNWNRYSAPEGDLVMETVVEYAPADFSDLLHAPVSRGGHLQLRDEQEWSSASGAQLSGFFALDLKLLSQSLACIPLHSQLKLPTNLLTAEEVNDFETISNHARGIYNPEVTEDVNAKLLNTCLYLDRSKTTAKDISVLITKKDNQAETFDALDIEINHKVHKIEGNENSLDSLNKDKIFPKNTTFKLLTITKETINVEKPDEIYHESEGSIQSNNIKLPINDKLEPIIGNIGVVALKEKNTKGKNLPKVSQTKDSHDKTLQEVDDKQQDMDEHISVGQFVNKKNCPGNNTSLTETFVNAVEQSNLENNCLEMGSMISARSCEKQIVNDSKKTPVTKENTKKIEGKLKNFILDDDDDLDFLLSLKTPVSIKAKNESNPSATKDSSFISGVPMVSQSSTQGQHLDLDNWLDSVLQD